MHSEVLSLVLIVACCQTTQLESGVKGWVKQFAQISQLAFRDPIHNLADSSTSLFAEPTPYYSRLSYAVLVGVAFKFLAWTLFVPLWPFCYKDDGWSLQVWVCCSSWTLFSSYPLFQTIYLIYWRTKVGRSSTSQASNEPQFGSHDVLESVGLHSFNKDFALFLLFSRGNRLVNGHVGEAWRAFQVAELSSAVTILRQILSDDHYAAKCRVVRTERELFTWFRNR